MKEETGVEVKKQKLMVIAENFFEWQLPGKPATATAQVKDVKFFDLNPQIADKIKNEYGKEIGTDKFQNWELYRNKKFLTLIWLENVKNIKPLAFDKKGRAGWVVLK